MLQLCLSEPTRTELRAYCGIRIYPRIQIISTCIDNSRGSQYLVSLTRRADDSLGEASNFGGNDLDTIPPTSANPVSSTGAISKNPSEAHEDTQNGMQDILYKIWERIQELSYAIKNHPRHQSGFPTRVTTVVKSVRGDYNERLINYLGLNVWIAQLVMDKIKLIPLKILRPNKTLFVKVTYFNLKSSFKERTKKITSEFKQHLALTNKAITKIRKDSNVIISEVKQIHDSFIRLYPIVKKQMDELIFDLIRMVGKHVLIDELENKDGYLSAFVLKEQKYYAKLVGVPSIPLVVTELPELPEQLDQPDQLEELEKLLSLPRNLEQLEQSEQPEQPVQLDQLEQPEEFSSPPIDLEIPQPVKKGCSYKKSHHSVR
ncbi:hypothetical protein BASA81_014757 [Batrachochytrium salamandrivorans]|nr:hypothetical protein BASA81_014757 [Batrachochytrium salamandrivorans]